MKTFKVADGDLVLGQGGFVSITGQAKVRQDLGISMREPLGCDRFHPRWGSILPNYIGEPITIRISDLVEAEVYRLVRNYMTVKANEMQSEFLRGNKSSFGSDEIVTNISKVDVAWNFDRIFVRVGLELSSGQQVALVTTMEA